MRITVTIASTGRPTLARTLDSLDAMTRPPGVELDVVIADDSRDGKAAAIVAGRTSPILPVTVLAVGAGNVSLARNACLDAATGDILAFVDDDEWVARDWLEKMLDAWSELGADCLFGPVLPQYPDTTPAWVKAADPLYTDWGPRGRVVTVGRCGNTLVRRSLIESPVVRFDPALGRVGGEDTDFFNRLARRGARMLVTDDALVYEDAPPHRLTVRHFRERAVRKGQIYARFRTGQPETGALSRAGFYAGAAAKTAVALGAAGLLVPLDRARALRLAMRGWMNLGKLRELARLEPPRWT